MQGNELYKEGNPLEKKDECFPRRKEQVREQKNTLYSNVILIDQYKTHPQTCPRKYFHGILGSFTSISHLSFVSFRLGTISVLHLV